MADGVSHPVFFLVCLLVLAAPSHQQSSPCSKLPDFVAIGEICNGTHSCVDGATCRAGRCAPLDGKYGVACQSSNDCRNPFWSLRCSTKEKKCVAPPGATGDNCRFEAECSSGLCLKKDPQDPNEVGVCEPKAGTCSSSATCRIGYGCLNTACLKRPVLGEACSSKLPACSRHLTCAAGKCVGARSVPNGKASGNPYLPPFPSVPGAPPPPPILSSLAIACQSGWDNNGTCVAAPQPQGTFKLGAACNTTSQCDYPAGRCACTQFTQQRQNWRMCVPLDMAQTLELMTAGLGCLAANADKISDSSSNSSPLSAVTQYCGADAAAMQCASLEWSSAPEMEKVYGNAFTARNEQPMKEYWCGRCGAACPGAARTRLIVALSATALVLCCCCSAAALFLRKQRQLRNSRATAGIPAAKPVTHLPSLTAA